jgi:hypothetical protein
LGKKFYNSLKIEKLKLKIFFLQQFKTKIIYNFVKFGATKKRYDNKFFITLSFVAVFGSGIRVPEWVKIRIRDPRQTSRIRNTGYRLCKVMNEVLGERFSHLA